MEKKAYREFKTILADLFYKKWAVANFKDYIQTQVDAISIDEKVKLQYSDKISQLEIRGYLLPEDIAFVLDVNRSTVQRWMNASGEQPSPDVPKLRKLSTIFKVRSDYFLGLEEIHIKSAQTDYEVFKQYHLDADAFQSLYGQHIMEKRSGSVFSPSDFGYITMAINSLLKESDLSVLTEIGKLFSSHKSKIEYKFIESDVQYLILLLQNLSTTSDKTIVDCLNDFLDGTMCNTSDKSGFVLIDSISHKLIKYKESLEPSYFTETQAAPFDLKQLVALRDKFMTTE